MINTDIINNKIIDSKLVTASDYTIQGVISEETWNAFREDTADQAHEKGYRPVIDFNQKLVEIIEKCLQESGLTDD